MSAPAVGERKRKGKGKKKVVFVKVSAVGSGALGGVLLSAKTSTSWLARQLPASIGPLMPINKCPGLVTGSTSPKHLAAVSVSGQPAHA